MSDTLSTLNISGITGSGLFASAPRPEPFSHTNCIPKGRPKTRPANKYAGDCVDCGSRVEAGAGYRFRSDDDRWVVAHHEDECAPETKAEATDGVRGGRFKAPEVHPGIYTVEGSETSSTGHRTFRVYLQPPDEDFAPGETLLQYLVGKDNDHDYKTIAFIKNGRARFFRRFREEPANAGVLADAIRLLDDPESALESKNCLRCNATLSRPDSIAAGLGPECIKVGW